MNPSASSNTRWKIKELQSYVQEQAKKNHSLPLIAVTETWLKSYILDAQVTIPNYTVTRCDREKRTGGGVLLYSHESIPVSECSNFDDGVTQALFCQFSTAKLSCSVIYRPPTAPLSSFNNALKFIRNAIQSVDDDSYTHCVTGDFNFPYISWDTGSIKPGGTSEDASAAKLLLKFINDHLMNQYVLSPTRGQNILDLFICNCDTMVANISTSITPMSDHQLIDIMLSTNLSDVANYSKPLSYDESTFQSLDFHKANFETLGDEIKAFDWVQLRSSCTFEEFPALFTDTLLDICKVHAPVKRRRTGRPHVLHALRRKKKRLTARYNAVLNRGDITLANNLKLKLALLCYDIKEAINNDLDRKESSAVEKIRSNPKFFFSYAKQFKNTKSSINMLLNNDEVVTDTKDMADILQAQFTSVFSDPNSEHIKPPDFPPVVPSKPFADTDFNISDEDIITAISEIKSNSAAGPDGIPAILLKNCSTQLCLPIKLIWTESMLSGIVPSFYKNSNITPLFKKGDRPKPSNYHPVSLTSHIIKIYERILRKVVVFYLESNQILCHNHQHGFRSG